MFGQKLPHPEGAAPIDKIAGNINSLDGGPGVWAQSPGRAFYREPAFQSPPPLLRGW